MKLARVICSRNANWLISYDVALLIYNFNSAAERERVSPHRSRSSGQKSVNQNVSPRAETAFLWVCVSSSFYFYEIPNRLMISFFITSGRALNIKVFGGVKRSQSKCDSQDKMELSLMLIYSPFVVLARRLGGKRRTILLSYRDCHKLHDLYRSSKSTFHGNKHCSMAK